MKSRKFSMIALSLIVIVLATVAGCKKENSGSKSVSVTVKTSLLNPGTSAGLQIPLQVGSLSILTANANIANVQIEENSGDQNQQEGDSINENGGEGNQQEGENNNGENDNEGVNSENDNGDIILPGPFALEISSGSSSLGIVNVYPGTFKQVDFQFEASATIPFNGNTIAITGNYINAVGNSIPFNIRSDFAEQIQLLIANGGIVATANSSQDIMILFDLNAWLNLNFAEAQITNGQIIIDSNNNAALLNKFNANIAANIDAENENK